MGKENYYPLLNGREISTFTDLRLGTTSLNAQPSQSFPSLHPTIGIKLWFPEPLTYYLNNGCRYQINKIIF
jgi:hypothetical protein